MMEFVNGKDDIPYIKWKIIQPCLKPSTSMVSRLVNHPSLTFHGPTSRTVTSSYGFHQSFYVFGKKIHDIPANFTSFSPFSQVFPKFFLGFSQVFPGSPWVPLKVHRSPRQAEEALQDAVQKTLGPGPWDAQNHLIFSRRRDEARSLRWMVEEIRECWLYPIGMYHL